MDPEAKVFGALDLTSGYHQLCLSEEDKDLTTFTLPFGRYRYEVLPMGLKPSSDHFNINSDKAVKKLRGTLKSVDDMLTTFLPVDPCHIYLLQTSVLTTSALLEWSREG